MKMQEGQSHNPRANTRASMNKLLQWFPSPLKTASDEERGGTHGSPRSAGDVPLTHRQGG